MYKALGWLGCFFLALSWTPSASAHKVSLFAWVEGNTVHTQSKFSGGRYVNDGLIEVYDPTGNKLLEGHTDAQGRFAFTVPQRSDLRIVLTAGSGHGNAWIVRAAELGAENPSGEGPPPSASDLPQGAQPVVEPAAGPCSDQRALEALIGTLLQRELASVRAEIAAQSWGLRDILAGLGYILGLVGLASFLHYRRLTRTIGGRG